MKKSSFQYGMKFSIENGFFIPGPALAAEKQGLGLKFSIENEIFKLRMKISSENEIFVRGGMIFSCVRARMNFFDPRALWVLSFRYRMLLRTPRMTKLSVREGRFKLRFFRKEAGEHAGSPFPTQRAQRLKKLKISLRD